MLTVNHSQGEYGFLKHQPTFPCTLPPNVDLAWYTIMVMSPAHGKFNSICALQSSTVKPLKFTRKLRGRSTNERENDITTSEFQLHNIIKVGGNPKTSIFKFNALPTKQNESEQVIFTHLELISETVQLFVI